MGSSTLARKIHSPAPKTQEKLRRKFGVQRIMDSAKEHISATHGNLYLFPQPAKHPEIPEEMPLDEDGIKARAKRMKCQVLSSKLDPETRIFRTSEEAWELVTMNLRLIKYAMRKHGMLIPNHPHKEYFFCLGIDAAYFAALTWDPKTRFITHLLTNMKRCWRPMMETMAVVPFSPKRAEHAKSYRDWKGKNPDGGPQEYAGAKKITLKTALKHEGDYHFQHTTANPLDAHKTFNGFRSSEGDDIGEKGNVSQRDVEAVLWLGNPLDLQRQLNVWDRKKTESRIHEILGRILNPTEQRVMHLRFKEGMTLKEAKGEFGKTREWVRQQQKKAILKLRSSSFAEELKEYYFQLN